MALGQIPWNKGKKIKEQYGGDRVKFPDEIMYTEKSPCRRGTVKARIIEDGHIPYECAICKMPPFWMGKPLTLILDHINGIRDDNRLTNLRFVCSNCDSQLDTYKSRNIGKNMERAVQGTNRT